MFKKGDLVKFKSVDELLALVYGDPFLMIMISATAEEVFSKDRVFTVSKVDKEGANFFIKVEEDARIDLPDWFFVHAEPTAKSKTQKPLMKVDNSTLEDLLKPTRVAEEIAKKTKPVLPYSVAIELEKIDDKIIFVETNKIINAFYLNGGDSNEYKSTVAWLSKHSKNKKVLFDALANGFVAEKPEQEMKKVDFSEAYKIMKSGGAAYCGGRRYIVKDGKILHGKLETRLDANMLDSDWYI